MTRSMTTQINIKAIYRLKEPSNWTKFLNAPPCKKIRPPEEIEISSNHFIPIEPYLHYWVFLSPAGKLVTIHPDSVHLMETPEDEQ